MNNTTMKTKGVRVSKEFAFKLSSVLHGTEWLEIEEDHL